MKGDLRLGTVYQMSSYPRIHLISLLLRADSLVFLGLQWTAEKDMRDTCFICSRDSYDFEHEGKVSPVDRYLCSKPFVFPGNYGIIHVHSTCINMRDKGIVWLQFIIVT